MADYNTAFGPAASGRGIKKCNKIRIHSTYKMVFIKYRHS